MNTEYINLRYLQLSQPIGDFYIGVIGWKDLISIADADIRKIHDEDRSEDSFDSYLGIQRRISPNRIKEIGDYVGTIDATFPTSIILHIDSETKLLNGKDIRELDRDILDANSDIVTSISNIIVDKENSILKIRKDEKIARILDGQHRIEGLRYGFNKLKNDKIPEFEFNVTIFIDLDLDDQAQVFSIINKAQTKVNKSLVYDLYEYANSRSPQKTSHDIVRLLNKLDGSPFHKKIKILGTTENESETIAQATFVELIIKYISKDPMKDRDILKRKSIFGKGKLDIITDVKQLRRYIFRNLFIQEKEDEIMKILWDYFKVVQEKWPDAWNGSKTLEGNILNKSTGLVALMRFLRPVYNTLNDENHLVKIENFRKIFESITLNDADFNKDNYIPGSSGQGKLYRDLLAMSGLAESNT